MGNAVVRSPEFSVSKARGLIFSCSFQPWCQWNLHTNLLQKKKPCEISAIFHIKRYALIAQILQGSECHVDLRLLQYDCTSATGLLKKPSAWMAAVTEIPAALGVSAPCRSFLSTCLTTAWRQAGCYVEHAVQAFQMAWLFRMLKTCQVKRWRLRYDCF